MTDHPQRSRRLSDDEWLWEQEFHVTDDWMPRRRPTQAWWLGPVTLLVGSALLIFGGVWVGYQVVEQIARAVHSPWG